MNAFGLLSMLVRENLIPGALQRTPESNAAMDTASQAIAWHSQGNDDGPIVPVYHLNAMAASRLARSGCTVVDLGCGSGRYAAYLARHRPDLRVVGLDLSRAMVETGNAALRSEGLGDRVQLRVGDMTEFVRDLPPDTGLISCLFAVHHLPTLDDVKACVQQIRIARDVSACNFWIFDLMRPRHAATAEEYPKVFTPRAPEVFQLDSTSSLLAAYSHRELYEIVDTVFGKASVQSARSLILPLYQAFWADAAGRAHLALPARTAGVAALSVTARRQYRALRALLPRLPQ